MKDIQTRSATSGSGDMGKRQMSEEERKKKEKEALEKKRAQAKGPQLVAKGSKWEPTGAGTGRAQLDGGAGEGGRERSVAVVLGLVVAGGEAGRGQLL